MYSSRLRYDPQRLELCDIHSLAPDAIKTRHWGMTDLTVVDADGTELPLSQAMAQAGIQLCEACERPSQIPIGHEVHIDCTFGGMGQTDPPRGLLHFSYYLEQIFEHRRTLKSIVPLRGVS